MSDILTPSPSESQRTSALLNRHIPSYRQAYSDRTAWIMACLSELAYIRFNPLFSNGQHKKHFLDHLSKLTNENKKSSLVKLIEMIGYDPSEEKTKLKNELNTLRLELIDTFDEDGTQAILVSNKKFGVLAFRGTEAMSIKDIKADAKASITQCETGGKIHSGFDTAFRKVHLPIQNKLNNSDSLRDKPLFITGHSLGGALATIAAKKLSHRSGIAACYTFGSPRVGDDEWITDIKTAVYRVVNAADCVTMLPPGEILISMLCLLARRIPHFGETIRAGFSKFGGYIHCGDMRYLTHCPKGQYADVKLLYHVSFLYRVKGFALRVALWKRFLADHSISIYRKKLMVVAEKRNRADKNLSQN